MREDASALSGSRGQLHLGVVFLFFFQPNDLDGTVPFESLEIMLHAFLKVLIFESPNNQNGPLHRAAFLRCDVLEGAGVWNLMTDERF